MKHQFECQGYVLAAHFRPLFMAKRIGAMETDIELAFHWVLLGSLNAN
jgi:hypothetical protein